MKKSQADLEQYHSKLVIKNCFRIGFLMPPDAGERGGMVVTILLVVVSIFLSVVQTVPPGNVSKLNLS